MRDPFAPVDVGDLVQLDDGRVAIVDEITDHTAIVKVLFGERKPHDKERFFINRFGAIKFILKETQDA